MARPTIHRFWRSAQLPFAESRCANDSTACYAPHAHVMLSLGAVDDGQSVFQQGHRRQKLTCGSTVFIPANEVHACNPTEDGRWSYQMLYLDESWVASVIGEGVETPPCGTPRPREHLCNRQLQARLTALNAVLFSPAGDTAKEDALLLFAGDVFTPVDTPMPPRTGADLLTRLQRTRSLIEDRFREPISLEELAATSGLSRYHLLRTFRQWTGLTPHAWQIDRRIQQARHLLDRDMPLTDIALHLGFADQSHFQRAFKQRVATTPGEYRRQRNIVQD